MRHRLRRWYYRSWLFWRVIGRLPLGRYRCSVCDKLISDRTCDRNLIANWAHCDRCMADLVAGMPD